MADVQSIVHETTVAGQSWFEIFKDERGPLFILIVILLLLVIMATWRLRQKDEKDDRITEKFGMNYEAVFRQQTELLEMVRKQEQDCQHRLANTEDKLSATTDMVHKLREKLFNRHILNEADYKELTDAGPDPSSVYRRR